jgi:hypothetical protein
MVAVELMALRAAVVAAERAACLTPRRAVAVLLWPDVRAVSALKSDKGAADTDHRHARSGS